MKKLLANLSPRQRVSIVAVALLVGAALYAVVRNHREADFKPLFTGLAPEDAAGIVQKLKEGAIEYRLPESGGAVLVPSARLAELRLSMAAAGLPKTGRIGFELFDKTNLGATEFTEHINYRRALEGELERSVMSLAEVEQARVHLTFPKDSVFLDSQQPAKASVLVKIRPGAHLAPQNVLAINHLVASAVEGLSPDAVSVLDMNGNLLGRPRSTDSVDGPGPSEAVLDFRHKVEADLLAKINSTLEPLLGANRFRAGVSVDCDFSGGDQSEEIFDPARSVMTSSQRTEDSAAPASSGGVPGTSSSLPRPPSRPGSSSGRTSRVTENILYQSSRTVKKTHLPAGTVRKMSVAVLVDQDLTWEREKNSFKRVLAPPTPEKLKIIHDLVAGVTGFSTERGDQLLVESLPFETTLNIEPPAMPASPAAPPASGTVPGLPLQWNRQTQIIAGVAAAVVLGLVIGIVMFLKRRKKRAAAVEIPTGLPSGEGATPESLEAAVANSVAHKIESQLAERDALQQKAEAKALESLKLAPVITKQAEVLAKHLREKITQDPELAAQVLRTWIREEENS